VVLERARLGVRFSASKILTNVSSPHVRKPPIVWYAASASVCVGGVLYNV
jgi:hypothetical protein